MAKKTAPLLPTTSRLLEGLGERLKLVRLRRKLTARQVSERAGMSLMTLRSIEAGGSGVTIGAYLSVLQVLGMEQDLTLVAANDPLGRQLQDARMTARPKPRLGVALAPAQGGASNRVGLESGASAPSAQEPIAGIVTGASLAVLIAPRPQHPEAEDDQ